MTPSQSEIRRLMQLLIIQTSGFCITVEFDWASHSTARNRYSHFGKRGQERRAGRFQGLEDVCQLYLYGDVC